MGTKLERAFRSLLGKAGYSEKAKNEVLKWYTSPTKKRKATKKRGSKSTSDFLVLYDSMYEEGPTIKYSNPDRWRD